MAAGRYFQGANEFYGAHPHGKRPDSAGSASAHRGFGGGLGGYRIPLGGNFGNTFKGFARGFGFNGLGGLGNGFDFGGIGGSLGGGRHGSFGWLF